MGRKTWVFLLSCLLVAFIGTGTGFTTRAEAFGSKETEGKTVQTAVAATEEAQIEPRFGGRSYATIPFVNSAGLTNGLTLYVMVYAENYIWPFSDKGHVYFLANFDPYANEIGQFPSGDVTISATMTYDWGQDKGSPVHSATYTHWFNGYFMEDFSDPKDYPYDIEMSSSAADHNNTGSANGSCYCIWVDITATYPDGCTATATNLMATF